MPQDIGPNSSLNKKMAILVALISALPLYMAIDSLTFLRPDDRGFAYVCFGIAAVILAWAAWIWMRPPINAASLKFREGGFHLSIRQTFRGNKQVDLAWSDIQDVTKFDGGLYGGRSFIIRSCSRGKNTFSVAWVDASSDVILERLAESASHAGFDLVKAPRSLASVMRTRFDVRHKDSQ